MAVASANMHPAIQAAPMLQQPEAVQHHRQQDEVGLPEIEHVEHEGHGDEARQRRQPGTGLAPDPVMALENCAVIHHADDVEDRQQR